MVDGDGMISECGIVLCNVLSHRRKFELSGTTTADQFYSSVRSRWGFENPEKYFINYCQTSMPQGQIGSTDHITAGNVKLDGTI